jgi:hypothetical protein
MLNAAYGMLALLPVAFWAGRVRDGVAMTASSPSPIAESVSSTIDPGAQVRRAVDGEPATLITRLRAKRAQRRREQREFKVWLAITAEPLWPSFVGHPGDQIDVCASIRLQYNIIKTTLAINHRS